MPTDTDPMPNTNGADLLVRARTDRVAFGRLYDLYDPRIFRHCLRRLFLRAVAEDVTSEGFLRVAKQIPKFTGASLDDFVRWVHAIATNEINAYLRQTQRRARLLDEAARRKAIRVVDQSASSPSLAELDWPRVYEALSTLKPRNQAIVTLRFFESMSHEFDGGYVCPNCGCETDLGGRKVPAGTGPQWRSVITYIGVLTLAVVLAIVLLTWSLGRSLKVQPAASPVPPVKPTGTTPSESIGGR